jgi:hypothetical protein
MANEAKTYEDFVIASGEVKRDLDVVYNPTFQALKKAFSIIFDTAGMNGSDFKRLSDMQFYQGGRPSPDSPPKENQLALQVARLIQLEELAGKRNFINFLEAQGITVDFKAGSTIPTDYLVSKDDEKKLLKAWQGAGIDSSIPNDRVEALGLLLNRSQNLQNEICDIQDGLKVESEEVEDKFKIKKGNFMKAVGLHALKLRKGDGAAGEKVDDVVDGAENLILAMEPLLKSSK